MAILKYYKERHEWETNLYSQGKVMVEPQLEQLKLTQLIIANRAVRADFDVKFLLETEFSFVLKVEDSI